MNGPIRTLPPHSTPSEFAVPAKATWRDDIDALAFRPAGHRGWCIVHRLALRTVIGRLAAPDECLAYFAANQPTFEAVARAKIERAALPPNANFHLTSRDLG